MLQPMLEFGLTTATVNAPEVPWGMVVEQIAFSNDNLILYGESAPWVIEAAKKLDAIGRLPVGWDSYRGASLDLDAKKLTASTLGWLGGKNLPVPSVVLAPRGTVQLEWRANGKELEIELGRNRVEFLQVHPDGSCEEGEEAREIRQALDGLTWWFLHGC